MSLDETSHLLPSSKCIILVGDYSGCTTLYDLNFRGCTTLEFAINTRRMPNERDNRRGKLRIA